MIKGLHHNAYRCRDSEETRRFYEDFLGLPLAATLWLETTKSGRETDTLHTFYEMDDGSYLAFFEVPDMPFEFKDQHDFDLHIALEVEPDVLEPMMEKGKAAGIETRGISDHGFIDSIYFRDPNGYVIELTAKRDNHDEATDPARNEARSKLDKWTAKRRRGDGGGLSGVYRSRPARPRGATMSERPHSAAMDAMTAGGADLVRWVDGVVRASLPPHLRAHFRISRASQDVAEADARPQDYEWKVFAAEDSEVGWDEYYMLYLDDRHNLAFVYGGGDAGPLANPQPAVLIPLLDVERLLPRLFGDPDAYPVNRFGLS